MSSSRLPGKVLSPIHGKPALQRVVERLGRSDKVQEVAVLTSSHESDDAVADLAETLGVPVVRGSLDDVLDRFRMAASACHAERIVRVTADCPLIDPGVVDRLVEAHDSEPDLPYAAVAAGTAIGNSSLRCYPNGLDAEVFPQWALERAWQETADAYDREHVTPYLRRVLAQGDCIILEAEKDWSDQRWTVDYQEDLEFVRAVYGRLGEAPFDYREVLELLEREPSLRRINAGRAASSA
jgi:spore coat polysaccharide biosynthesis protein SpsF